MNLTYEEFQLGRNVVEDCLKLDDGDIENYIQDSIKSFIKELDKSKLDDRNKIFSFLQHQSTLFVNFGINSDIYLLGEREEKKCRIGISVINKIIKDFRESGLEDYGF